MVTPLFLKQGDTVGIVSTARKISKTELQPFLVLLKNWGLNYELGASIEAESHQFAGDDSLRTRDFQRMLNNHEIKAIWCARGGYGTVRIIDTLDFSVFRNTPKWIIGYSDVTVLHSHIHNFGIETLHAQMPLDIEKKSKEAQEGIFEVLFGNNYEVSTISEEKSLHRNGTAKGLLIGGNLSILYSLLGSPSAIKTEGKILFIEDLDEYLYHIDRMMQNLKRNNLLKNLAGLVVGGMSEMRDNTIPFGKTAREIIFDAVSEYNFPLCFDFPAGHINNNRALIMGREVQLNVTNSKVTLTF